MSEKNDQVSDLGLRRVLRILRSTQYPRNIDNVNAILVDSGTRWQSYNAWEPGVFDVEIRLHDPFRNVFGILAEDEAAAESQAWQALFCSPLVACTTEWSMRWRIESPVFPTSTMLRECRDYFRSIVQQIARLHNSALLPVNVWSASFGIHYLQLKAEELGAVVPPDIELALRELEKIARGQSVTVCATNNSLIPGAIAWRRRKRTVPIHPAAVRFLNWERTALGDPLFELARFGVEFELDSEQWQELELIYFRSPSSRRSFDLRVARVSYFAWKALQGIVEQTLPGGERTEVADSIARSRTLLDQSLGDLE